MIAAPGTGRLAVALGFALLAGGPVLADPTASAASPNCAVPTALSAIMAALHRSASRIEADKSLTIVAMGSSSTLGVGATSSTMSYPSRLERELSERFPDSGIKVINNGIGGQDIPEELIRLERDVTAERPDLVIWQVGTNAVLRRDDLSRDEQLIARGVGLLKQEDIDVVLMDLQYAPRVLARPASAEMERLIAAIARQTHVGLFRRFEIMAEWDRTHQLAPAEMIGADGLHMTDVSYGCLAKQLAEALASNWRSHAKLAKPRTRNSEPITEFEGSAMRNIASSPPGGDTSTPLAPWDRTSLAPSRGR